MFINSKKENIVITGTSSGIGYDIAKKFLKDGNIVWGCSRRGSKIKHRNYKHQKLDLSDLKEISNWIKKIKIQTFSKIDILILNAAFYKRSLNYFETNQNLNKTIRVNLISSIILAKEISKLMIFNKKGKIFFLSSSAMSVKDIGTSSYAASKAGLEVFAEVLNKELKKFDIKIFIFRINYIKTRLSKNMKSKEIKNLLEKFKTNIFSNTAEIYKKLILYSKSNARKKQIIINDKLK